MIADVNWYSNYAQLFHQHADSAQELAYVFLWSQIEVDVAITAASLPGLSLLLEKVWIGFSYGSASPYENPTYAKGRQSYGLQSRRELSELKRKQYDVRCSLRVWL